VERQGSSISARPEHIKPSQLSSGRGNKVKCVFQCIAPTKFPEKTNGIKITRRSQCNSLQFLGLYLRATTMRLLEHICRKVVKKISFGSYQVMISAFCL
jgi:hypothetical protein